MLNRRSVLGSFASLGAAAGVATLPKVAEAKVTPTLPPPVFGPLINLQQADKVMSELDLDAIVLGQGVNVYHATGLDLTATKMGHTPIVLAVISRRAGQRISVIAPAFLFYYTVALDARHSDYPIYLFDASVGTDPDAEITLDELPLYPDLQQSPLDNIERERLDGVRQALTNNPARPNVTLALAQVFKDLGIGKGGRIAGDWQTVRQAVAAAAPAATVVNADDALRRIRPVKSPLELQLMSYAAQANAEAALEAARAIRAGADVRELRAAYFSAAAKRGMQGVFMVIDRVSSPTYQATLRDGQCLSIDCVSHYMGYHGDFARAIHIGEPTKTMRRVSELTGKSWDLLREQLKPGLRFSEVRALGKAALKSLGADFPISFTPHSVGLFHSDHVGNLGSPRREDIMLEPNMVLSVDCPLGATGMGGSSHLEDLMLITSDGAQPLNDIGSKVVMV